MDISVGWNSSNSQVFVRLTLGESNQSEHLLATAHHRVTLRKYFIILINPPAVLPSSQNADDKYFY